MDGLLVVDKPAGLTSFDVVRRVRAVARRQSGDRKIKVGHTGTLDPFATGVLPVAIGKATRLAQFLIDGDKRYRATLRLGVTTDTGDCDGTATQTIDPAGVSRADVEAALSAWVGPHDQVPPAFSAIKVDGRRAYDEARAGRPMDLPARSIVIHAIAVGAFALPDVEFEVHSSKGTYIRALCRDVGQALGVGGHCAALRRLDAAGFAESESVPLDAVESGVALPLVPCMEMLRALPCVVVDTERAVILGNGGWVPLPETVAPIEGPVTVTVDGQRLLCVGRIEGDRLLPVRVVDV